VASLATSSENPSLSNASQLSLSLSYVQIYRFGSTFSPDRIQSIQRRGTGLSRPSADGEPQRVGWVFTFAAAAYNLVRIRNLIRSAPQPQCT